MEKAQGMRRGTWTKQEDMQLVCYVRLFGQRRWDFLAKVSGLNRNGKGCRLRWVNYLHPGLKLCQMSPQEEKLVLQLHARWGNRWSLIARKLPGRTDNEIKNYWRTLMRKKAQEMKRNESPSSSSTSGSRMSSLSEPQLDVNEKVMKSYSMDQIWNEIISSEYTDEARNILSPPIPNAEEPKKFHHTCDFVANTANA